MKNTAQSKIKKIDRETFEINFQKIYRTIDKENKLKLQAAIANEFPDDIRPTELSLAFQLRCPSKISERLFLRYAEAMAKHIAHYAKANKTDLWAKYNEGSLLNDFFQNYK